MEDRYKFVSLPDNDFGQYESLIKPLMDKTDYAPPTEILRLKKERDFHSWILLDQHSGQWAGWCAAGRNLVTRPGAIHLYGGVIFPAWRGRGLSHLLYGHRLKIYEGKDLTASIQPHNIQSMNIALKHGFKPFLYQEPWIEWLREG